MHYMKKAGKKEPMNRRLGDEEIRALLNGDEQALGRMVGCYRGLVRHMCHAHASRYDMKLTGTETDDMMQTVLIRLVMDQLMKFRILD